jgi:hypothetical protein
MKQSVYRRMIRLLLTLSLLVAPAVVLAGSPETGGLFGNIRLGGGIAAIHPSGLEVLDDNQRRDNPGNKARKQTESLILLGAELGYAFKETGTTLALTLDTEGPLSLALGQEVNGLGTLSLSARYEKKDAWQDPHLVGVDRRRTDAESRGLGVNWESILGTGAQLVFEQMWVDVEDDLSGQLEPGLRRDGKDTTLGMGYAWNFAAAGVLRPKLSYVWLDRDGAANSGRGYGVELQHLLGVGRLSFATRLEWKRMEFDAIHPLFQQTRQETTCGMSEMISLAEPFGMENWSLFSFFGIAKTNANIRFFDSSILISGAGIGYKF